jgi:hypothetical protein
MANVKNGVKRTTINLCSEEYEALRFLAFKRKTSVAGLVYELIKEVLEDEEDIRDGLKSLQVKGDSLDWETFKKEHLGL